jgi:uncharacterized membrane protein
LAAIAWIGSGLLIQILLTMAERRQDDATFGALMDYTAGLGLKLFVPSSLVVVACGIGLVADGPWSFDQLWVVLGLAGFAATFLTGALVVKPRADRLAEITAANGGVLTPAAMYEARKLLALGRTDYVVLVAVVFDMAVKPTGDDTGALAVIALAVAAGLVYVVRRSRQIEAPPAPVAVG